MMTFDQEKIDEQYELYKKAKAQREADLQALAAQREAEKTFWAAKTPVPHVTKKVHVCSGCGQEIPIGSQVTTRPDIRSGSSKPGYGAHFETRYYCLKCRKIEEA